MNRKSWLVASLLVALASACSESQPASSADPSEAAPAVAAPAAEPATPAADPATAGSEGALTLVADRSLVCMVNDQFMGQPQIPIEVEGRTYYGCCAMCKERLGKEPGARTAQDPVTGEQVDKATAVMIQDANGKVLYFASEDTLRRFRG